MKALTNGKSLNAFCSAIVLVGAFLLPNIVFATAGLDGVVPLTVYVDSQNVDSPYPLDIFVYWDDVDITSISESALYTSNDCSGDVLRYPSNVSNFNDFYSLFYITNDYEGDFGTAYGSLHLTLNDGFNDFPYCLDIDPDVQVLVFPSGGSTTSAATSTYDLLMFDTMSTTSFYGILVFFISFFTTIWIWSTFIL